MYEEFYGLRTKPFSILPDASFLYRSRGHRVALSLLEYGLGSQTGFTVITGEIGSGKTTLVQHLLKNADSDHTIGYVTNTSELNNDLMRWVLFAFGLHCSGRDVIEAYSQFLEFVRSRYDEERGCVLIIDEAQLLGPSALEAVRLLSNVNVGTDHLLKVMLVGQPELLKTLGRPDLVQFAQRVSSNFHLKPLSLLETREYIRTRLRVAGGSETLFDEDACDLIFAVSGIPRQINILCDTTLVYGYADGRERVDLSLVVSVLKDRSAAQSLGTMKIPEPIDLATAGQMIRDVRAEEMAKGIEASPPPDMGDPPWRPPAPEFAVANGPPPTQSRANEQRQLLRFVAPRQLAPAMNNREGGVPVDPGRLARSAEPAPRDAHVPRVPIAKPKFVGVPPRHTGQRSFKIDAFDEEPQRLSLQNAARHDQEPNEAAPERQVRGGWRRLTILLVLVLLIVGAVIFGSKSLALT